MGDLTKNRRVDADSMTLARRTPNDLARRGLKDIEAGRGQQQRTIFVVDDEEQIRDVICSMLTPSGYVCRAFANGVEVLPLLDGEEQCDLVITDLLNAPMDGQTFIRRLREQHPKVRIIVASMVHDPDIQQQCLDD